MKSEVSGFTQVGITKWIVCGGFLSLFVIFKLFYHFISWMALFSIALRTNFKNFQRNDYFFCESENGQYILSDEILVISAT